MKNNTILINDKIIDISGFYYFNDNFNYPEIIQHFPVEVKGNIINNDYQSIHINCNIKTKIKILDSITLEEIIYPINLEVDEDIDKIYIKNENSLDILAFLWENIVLEVPT